MKFYFTTRQIQGLSQLPLKERLQLLDSAARKLTVPEKTILNVLKLLVIVPVFVLVLQTANDWRALLWAGLIILLYPLFVKPVQYSLSAKYIKIPVNKES
ncbi:MAG: hypothetical protein CL531_07800 [Aestuariibacter sp.]|nr:hypothetical protein [Aestuariibacter sp.]